MGQAEVYAFLKKHRGKFFTVPQLAEALKVAKSSAAVAIRKVHYHWEEVMRLEVTHNLIFYGISDEPKRKIMKRMRKAYT